MKVSTKFNEIKATQAAAVFLKIRGNPNLEMSYMKLIKLLYLADRESLLRWDRTISSDNFVSMDKGPVLSHVLDRINEGARNGESSYWVNHITQCGNREVRLTLDPSDDELSEAECELLSEVFAKYGHLSRWEIVDYVHTLPEWKNPNGSAIPIKISDILKAEKKSPKEIEDVVDHICEYEDARTLFNC